MSSVAQERGRPRRPRLLGRLLIGVNLSLVIVLGLFFLWNYYAEWDVHIGQIKASLEGEAKALLPTIERLRPEGRRPLQQYLDEVCGSMRETTSPGHHIAVVLGEEEYQALAHGRASPEVMKAMKAGALDEQGTAPVGQRTIVVGSTTRGDVSVFVAEYLSNVKRILRWQVLRSVLGLAVAGAVLGVVLNVLLGRLLVQPLRDIADAVHRIDQGELGVRLPEIGTQELGRLADEFNRTAADLERAEVERHARMDRARRIQANLLPDLTALPNVDVAALYGPATDLAGDYYDIFSYPDGSLLVCVADVTGHGVAAAMGAAMLKALLQVAGKAEGDPAALLQLLNVPFTQVSLPEDFATLILVHFDPSNWTIHYASAGHEPGYLFHTGDEPELLESTGTLVGLDESTQWSVAHLHVEPGDRLILVTDGFADTPSPSGDRFGNGRLLAVLKESWEKPLAELGDLVVRRVGAFRGAAPQEDDMTMLALEFHV